MKEPQLYEGTLNMKTMKTTRQMNLVSNVLVRHARSVIDNNRTGTDVKPTMACQDDLQAMCVCVCVCVCTSPTNRQICNGKCEK